MRQAGQFPLPFTSNRRLSGGTAGTYLVGSMFTAAYARKAARLAASCEKFGLPYEFHEVPTIHHSISPSGTDDLAYTKPNFIRQLIAAHGKPVLYVDADCEFAGHPVMIADLAAKKCDFAVYNWCADECTDQFVPVQIPLKSGESMSKNRYYRFAGGAFDVFSRDQLVCSGLVQFYGDSYAGRAMLRLWHRTIAAFPGCADDGALAFAFNNLTRRTLLWWLLRWQWLPKAYARIAWWIYVRPVINHEEIPTKSDSFLAIKDLKGRRIFYLSETRPRHARGPIPRDCIIDTERRMLCKLVDNQLVPIGPLDQEIWL